MKQLTREEKIQAIYEKIGYNEFIEDLFFQLLLFVKYPKSGELIFIGDVFYYIEQLGIKDIIKQHNIKVRVDELWKDKRKPIDDQPEECINFIHSLLKDE